jgi:DNA-binding LacI/PurR family transcriptional regulator
LHSSVSYEGKRGGPPHDQAAAEAARRCDRDLRRRHNGAIGVVLGEHLAYAFEDPQARRFLAGVAEVCRKQGSG